MTLKSGIGAELHDAITPPAIQLVKVETPAEKLEWLAKRAKEAKEKMGSSYLCHEKNRVRRLDEQSPQATKTGRLIAPRLRRTT